MTLLAKVITVSDGVIAGTREDRSGAAAVAHLTEAGFEVVAQTAVADGVDEVSAALRAACDGFTGLVVTSGGTGFGPRDRQDRKSGLEGKGVSVSEGLGGGRV